MTDTNNQPVKEKITYINPEADLTALDTGLKTMINTLTTNSYIDSEIVDKFSLNEAIEEEN